MPRGGKRPSAGAPQGNLNAMKPDGIITRTMLCLFEGTHDEWESIWLRVQAYRHARQFEQVRRRFRR